MSDKPFKTIDQLASLLIDDRGLSVDDPESLNSFLAHTNYYRFSGYAREFQRDPRYGDNRFVEGATFEEIRRIIDIDADMRSLLLKQLSVVEIALRSMLAYEYGRAYGEKAFYLDFAFYNDSPNPKDDRPSSIVRGILSDLDKDKSNMVSRYVDRDANRNGFEDKLLRYSNVPIWVAVEVMSFGRVSNLITYAKDAAPARAAAASYGLQWAPFADIVHSLSVLRNLCAHHRQLWNRRMGILCPVQKKLRPRNMRFDPTSAYCQVIMLNNYRLKIDGDRSVSKEIDALIRENPEYSDGFLIPRPK